MKNQIWIALLCLLGSALFNSTTYAADAVAELVQASQSNDTAVRKGAQAKLRTLLKTNFGVPGAQLDGAVEKLTEQLVAFEKARQATTKEYAVYTANLRSEMSAADRRHYAQLYESRRDGEILQSIFNEFVKPLKRMTPAEVAAQKAFIKLLMPQFTAYGPDSYFVGELDKHFREEPAYQTGADKGPTHLFYDEMKEAGRRVLYTGDSRSGLEDFKEMFRKVLKNDPYGLIPNTTKEARMDALADILLKASERFGYQFKLESFLNEVEGKTSFVDASKNKVEYQIDRFDIAGRMVQRLQANQITGEPAIAATRRLLDFLGVYRGGDSSVTRLIDWDQLYRESGTVLNERNAIVQAKNLYVLSQLVTHIRKHPELANASLSEFSNHATIGGAADGMWADRERKYTAPAGLGLADAHCVVKLGELYRGGLHSQTAPK